MKRIVKKIMPILTILSCFATHAQNTTIKVLDASTEPLANIVVYLEPEDKSIITQNFLSVTDAATMDQVNRQFLPHILVVHKNTQIDFPNSDKIKHHVYSFSPAKTFEIKLYSDKPSGPRLFDHVGEVTLGCNIHDWMLGYVYVVDTPWFGKTDAKGSINFDIPDGKYTLKTWHPLFQETDQSFTQKVDILSNSQFTVNVKEAMKPKYSAYEEDDELDDY